MAGGWESHTGRAAALPRQNVDTDQLIPARFMSRPRSAGYGDYLLHDLRRNGEGLDPDFPLNRREAEGASVLVTGRNFGSGSSREAAVYALVDAGFKAVLAPSFGDIFRRNAVNNGLLPGLVDDCDMPMLFDGCPGPFAIDLAGQQIVTPRGVIAFALPAHEVAKIASGWDDIDITLYHREAIGAFRARHLAAHPFVRPRR